MEIVLSFRIWLEYENRVLPIGIELNDQVKQSLKFTLKRNPEFFKLKRVCGVFESLRFKGQSSVNDRRNCSKSNACLNENALV